jgi:hypothetical protein
MGGRVSRFFRKYSVKSFKNKDLFGFFCCRQYKEPSDQPNWPFPVNWQEMGDI